MAAALAAGLLGCAHAPEAAPAASPAQADDATDAPRTRGLVVAAAARPQLQTDTPLSGPDALRRPFTTPLPATVRTAQGSRQRLLLEHCGELLERRHALVGSDSDAHWRVLRVQQVECEILALAQRALPPRSTAWPRQLGADAPALAPTRLPASLWVAPSPDERAELARPDQTLALATGVQAWQAGPADAGTGATLQLEAHGMRLRLTLRLRTDVDGDGWEDLVFAWEAQAQHGSYADARTLVLVWPGPEAPLRERDPGGLLRQ